MPGCRRRKQRPMRALHERLDQSEQHSQRSAAQTELLASQLACARQHLHAVLQSTSWRVSAPLRAAGAPFRRLTSAIRERRLRSVIKRRIKTVLHTGTVELTRRSALKRAVIRAVKLSPTLERRLRTVVTMQASTVSLTPPQAQDEPALPVMPANSAVSRVAPQPALSQSALEVLAALRAIARSSGPL